MIIIIIIRRRKRSHLSYGIWIGVETRNNHILAKFAWQFGKIHLKIYFSDREAYSYGKDNMRLVWWIDLWMFHFLLNKDTFFRLSHFMIFMTGRKAYTSL